MKSHSHGLSLTELMVATLLLSLTTAGGLGALAHARASQRESTTLQQLHERAQFVFATLEPELQMAGFFADDSATVSPSPGPIPESARRCGEALLQLHPSVRTSDAWQLDCAANGGGAVPDSDVLTLIRLSAQLADGPENGRAQWLSSAGAPGEGRLYWDGSAQWTRHDALAGLSLRDLILRIYYVAQSADGDTQMPALRVKSLTAISGAPGFLDTEVMNGIENLQVELLPSPDAPQSVQVQLRVRSDPRTTGAQFTRTLDVARRFTLRNALPEHER